MNIPVKGKNEWTKEEWLAYKAEAETFNNMVLNISKSTRAIKQMDERED